MSNYLLGYTSAQKISLQVLFITSVLLYCMLLCLVIYNIYWFLYKQQRFRIYFISSFYTFAMLVIILRLAQYNLLMLVFYSDSSQIKRQEKTLVFAEAFDAVASYMTICVGLFQIVAMIVLTKQLQRFDDDKLTWYENKMY